MSGRGEPVARLDVVGLAHTDAQQYTGRATGSPLRGPSAHRVCPTGLRCRGEPVARPLPVARPVPLAPMGSSPASIRATHRVAPVAKGEFMLNRSLLLFTAAVALNSPIMALAYEYDAAGTEKLMMQLVADIGGHDAVARNSGRTLRCSHGGTRKITIVRGKGKTSYTGEYLNCNQNGFIRDGIFEIELQGNEVVKSTARRSKNGELFDAAMEGDTARVGKLIKSKADVNYSESIENSQGGTIDQWTPLMSAVARGNRESVGMLVKSGAWVNYMNGLAVSPLWLAANSGQTDIVKY
ncbi:ankyrin repeat domain-containing protein, partial [bacterium]|nr:ankyrin repeat domain-containing protein [bacterium]